jgi:hypothetical protein
VPDGEVSFWGSYAPYYIDFVGVKLRAGHGLHAQLTAGRRWRNLEARAAWEVFFIKCKFL